MFVFSILALLIVAMIIAYRNKCELYLSLPVATGGLILVLYVLAYFRALKYIDAIGVLTMAVVIYLVIRGRSKVTGRTETSEQAKVTGYALLQIITPVNLVLLVTLIALTISQLAVQASWWDDLNFWATDAKAMYYLGGFPGKYGNVAPEFGDYPPTLSLFKWFFMHFSSVYVEGLGYSAYQCLNFILLIPLLRGFGRGKWKYIPVYAIACGILYYIPSVCNVVGYEGACADVTMALLYGNLLWFIWKLAENYRSGATDTSTTCAGGNENTDIKSDFYIWGIAILSSVLVLTKSVGVEWVAYSFVFFLLMTRNVPKGDIRKLIAVWGLPVICEASWLGFCLVNRRVAKLTSSGVHMVADGNMDLKGYAIEKAEYFIRGFLVEPMHTGHSGALDLPASVYLILLIVVICIMMRQFGKEKGIDKKLLIYTLVTALMAYGIVFIGHITIFAAETQYASSDIMAISMSRYAAPFTLGMLILIFNLVLELTNNKSVAYGAIAVFVLITCEYITPLGTLYGYREALDMVAATRADMTGPATEFIDTVADNQQLWGQRVLYLRDDHKAQWVSSAYINLECAPVAVVYGGIANDTMTRDDMEYILSSSHAAYVYSDEVEGDATALFEGIVENEFEYNRLYRYENGHLVVVK